MKQKMVGVAVASAGSYADHLFIIPEDNHVTTSSLNFLRAVCSSWRQMQFHSMLTSIKTMQTATDKQTHKQTDGEITIAYLALASRSKIIPKK